jgi:hypothetical protein
MITTKTVFIYVYIYMMRNTTVYNMNSMLCMFLIIIGVVLISLILRTQFNESFQSKRPIFNKSHSVELYNPSIYSGYFIRKFDVPSYYTQTTTTYPINNRLHVTKTYTTHGTSSTLKTKNTISPLWNIPNVYPLQNRRNILI